MDQNTLWIVIAAAAVVGVAIVAWAVYQVQRSKKLRGRFGPEYERTVREIGDRRKAEAELAARQRRVGKLEIRSLRPEEQARFEAEWNAAQGRFVDDPKGAVLDANRLIKEVMLARGYPMTDFEQRAADLSVDHPRLVANYRSARQITARLEEGKASTEDLRQSVIFYRGLFEELLESPRVVERKAS